MNEAAVTEAQKLSRITFITNFGDFLTYFSVIKLVYTIKGDAFAAAFGGVGIGSGAAVFAGLTLPLLKRHLNTKTLIVLSQVISFIVVGLLLWGTTADRGLQEWVLFLLLFLQTYFSKTFESARETHTHALNAAHEDHRGIQSLLLEGFYRAQFLGPLVAFFLLKLFPPGVPVLLDLLTFLIAGSLSLGLSTGPCLDERLGVWRAIGYLNRDSDLRKLFLLRTFGFWIPASFFNAIIYENAVKRFGIGVEYSGVIYSVLGFGALLGSMILQGRLFRLSSRLSEKSESAVAAIAQVGLALTIGLLVISENLVWGTFCYLVYGVFMGFNAISTQAMRRHLCSKDQLPEIIGLEAITSFATQALLTFFIAYVWSRMSFAVGGGLALVATSYCLTALLFKNWVGGRVST